MKLKITKSEHEHFQEYLKDDLLKKILKKPRDFVSLFSKRYDLSQATVNRLAAMLTMVMKGEYEIIDDETADSDSE